VIAVLTATTAGNAYAAPTRIETAYAHILGNGTIDIARSKGVVAISGGNGLYCFKLRFTPRNAVATLADDPAAPDQGLGFVKVSVPPITAFTCPTIKEPDGFVETGSVTGVNAGESAGGYPFYVYWSK
jgi:hypothetical protein